MLKTMQKHGVTLAIFAAALTGLTALVNELTKTTIAEQAMKQQKALFDQVIPSDLYDNDLQKAALSCRLRSSVKDPIAFILPARAIIPWVPSWKPPRRTVTPVRFSCWWAAIFPAPCWVRA